MRTIQTNGRRVTETPFATLAFHRSRSKERVVQNPPPLLPHRPSRLRVDLVSELFKDEWVLRSEKPVETLPFRRVTTRMTFNAGAVHKALSHRPLLQPWSVRAGRTTTLEAQARRHPKHTGRLLAHYQKAPLLSVLVSIFPLIPVLGIDTVEYPFSGSNPDQRGNGALGRSRLSILVYSIHSHTPSIFIQKGSIIHPQIRICIRHKKSRTQL